MNSIIFLDIDGVLCTLNEYYRSTAKFWKKNDFARELRMPYEFNPGCVKVLNQVLEKTDADIVISSDWRTHWNLEELGNIFKYNKVVKVPIDVTEVCPTSISYLEKNRAQEIDIYIKKYHLDNFENYVILDDLDLSQYHTPYPQGKFIRTIEREGIKQSGIKEKILRSLNYEQK